MNPTGKLASTFYAVLLLACGSFAAFDTFAIAFGIGDGGGQVSVAAGTLLVGTLAGGAGLAIASLGSWTRWRTVSLIVLVSAIVVLPAAILYGWQSAYAFWVNSANPHLRMHYGLFAWGAAILPPFLDLAAVAFSWLRFRKLKFQPGVPLTP